jgi:hypothetical protein
LHGCGPWLDRRGRGGGGTGIQLSDWREVDRVLAITGAWLLERDLALAVGVEVAEIPRPVASGR